MEDEIIHSAPDTDSGTETVINIVPGENFIYFKLTKDELLAQLGEPDMIFSDEGMFYLNNLPEEYNFLYSGKGLSFLIKNNRIQEITIISPDYRFINGIGIGSAESEIISSFDSSYQRLDLGSKIYLIYNKLGLTFKISKNDDVVWEIVLKNIDRSAYGLIDRINMLKINSSTFSDIIDIFGEPEEYSWGNRIYTRKNLPDYYFMKYSNGLSFLMNNYNIIEIGIQTDDYVYGDKLKVGSSLNDVLSVMGEPDEIITGQSLYFKNGILYKNIDGENGSYYYERKELGLRVFLKNNLVFTIYLMPAE